MPSLSKKPVIFPKIGESFDDLFDTLANTPTPTEPTPKKKNDKPGKSNENKRTANKEK
jgi:hypothetical protein